MNYQKCILNVIILCTNVPISCTYLFVTNSKIRKLDIFFLFFQKEVEDNYGENVQQQTVAKPSFFQISKI